MRASGNEGESRARRHDRTRRGADLYLAGARRGDDIAACMLGCSLSNRDIAARVNDSSAARWRRMRALEERGVISGYRVELD